MAKRKSLADLVPTNWLDPLLTGPESTLAGKHSFDCKDIENLLLAVKERIAGAEKRRRPQNYSSTKE